MHKLSVGAIFKNESHALVEWIEHYLFHGVEHFYLIDDNFTDGGYELIKPFIQKGIVDYVKENNLPMKVGRMQDAYDRHVLPRLKETEWLLICDLDEFIWSPHAINLRAVLDDYASAPAVSFSHTMFGSNGHVAYPDGIVKSYTRRETHSPSATHELLKYFVNTRRADVRGLFIHWPILGNNQVSANGQGSFVFNHYLCQCREWWEEVKGRRGIGAGPRAPGDDGLRSIEEFNLRDRNEVEDLRLYEQNKPLYEV